MRPAPVHFLACLIFLASVGVSRAESPERGPAAALPKVGETVTIEAHPAAYGWHNNLRDVGVRVGDPDDERFEMDCTVEPPFTVSVLGGFETTVVLRYETTKKQKDPFGCKHGGIVIVSQRGWESLKGVETTVATTKAAKERRRETIRG